MLSLLRLGLTTKLMISYYVSKNYLKVFFFDFEKIKNH